MLKQQRRASYRDRGVVLYTTKYGEKKLIVHLLTSQHGRCSYVVSVTKNSSRNLFQPLYLIEFEGVAPSAQGLHTMRDVVLCPPLRTIPSSPNKAMIVMLLGEILYRVVKDSDSSIHRLCHLSVLQLDSLTSPMAIANFHLYFLVQLASLLGYSPPTDYSAGNYFDIKESCYTPNEPLHTLYFKPEIAELLYRLTQAEFNELNSIELRGSLRREFLYAFVDYLGYHNESIYSVRSISIFSDML